MQQRLLLINIILPLAVLGLPYFAGDLVFKIPEYLVLALMLIVLGRAYLLLQQQTVFAVLPVLLLGFSYDGPLQLDINAPFATPCFLLYLWFVNLQWGQKSWWHPLHILNLCFLLLFVCV